MRTHSTRRIFAVAATLTALGLLTACAGGATPAPAATEPEGDGPATLWVRAADAPLDEKLVEAWNAENPDREIELVAIPDAQYVQKFIQAVRSGDVPDIAVVDIANAQALVTENLLQDITAQVDGLEYRDEARPCRGRDLERGRRRLWRAPPTGCLASVLQQGAVRSGRSRPRSTPDHL
ncbi:extracellular solute-binding protein [Microbacterium sp. ET2]|uniref:extracellular solute-binding protein n=1 Tax=Microbacterium albipurpureum TaxID=3050384 RepID=UPI00259CEF2F|nr:extracellular solute-binding protein [Microbacterium sp. ET2 (Ac-2212)]WJL97049.1 extracellular solute-binding protein [Microbacterium sp. ET2 (Ac-2212)]